MYSEETVLQSDPSNIVPASDSGGQSRRRLMEQMVMVRGILEEKKDTCLDGGVMHTISASDYMNQEQAQRFYVMVAGKSAPGAGRLPAFARNRFCVTTLHSFRRLGKWN